MKDLRTKGSDTFLVHITSTWPTTCFKATCIITPYKRHCWHSRFSACITSSWPAIRFKAMCTFDTCSLVYLTAYVCHKTCRPSLARKRTQKVCRRNRRLRILWNKEIKTFSLSLFHGLPKSFTWQTDTLTAIRPLPANLTFAGERSTAVPLPSDTWGIAMGCGAVSFFILVSFQRRTHQIYNGPQTSNFLSYLAGTGSSRHECRCSCHSPKKWENHWRISLFSLLQMGSFFTFITSGIQAALYQPLIWVKIALPSMLLGKRNVNKAMARKEVFLIWN